MPWRPNQPTDRVNSPHNASTRKFATQPFEALAPHVIWAMDICYLYTRKQDGFERYLMTILDDHSRTVIASGLYERQTVSEVVEVLKAAVLTYGVPRRLVCDHGSQFTCSEFRRVCAAIQLTVDYAPPHYPQYKGKIERFFRTAAARCLVHRRLQWPQDCMPYG